MESMVENLDLLVVVIGAFIGSMKASIEFDKDKTCFYRGLDVALGMFCGVLLAHHFHNEYSTALSGLLALIGGVSGAVVVEVFMQMLPNIAKKAIKNVVDKSIK